MSAFRVGVYLRARRIRRAVVAEIAPFLEMSRRRVAERLEASWRQPYVIGYLSMLISLAAIAASRGRIADEELGLVQIEAWRMLTRQPDDEIGEEIHLLSAGLDADFVDGCRNARAFWETYRGGESAYGAGASDPFTNHLRPEGDVETVSTAYFLNSSPPSQSADVLWRSHFEERL